MFSFYFPRMGMVRNIMFKSAYRAGSRRTFSLEHAVLFVGTKDDGPQEKKTWIVKRKNYIITDFTLSLNDLVYLRNRMEALAREYDQHVGLGNVKCWRHVKPINAEKASLLYSELSVLLHRMELTKSEKEKKILAAQLPARYEDLLDFLLYEWEPKPVTKEQRFHQF